MRGRRPARRIPPPTPTIRSGWRAGPSSTTREALPDAEREIFDLLWYQGLSQREAAALLGITERMAKRRWRAARLKIHERLGGRLPG